ncbi:MAG: TonB-dependent receptor [Gemmatimonadaceae bacterium]|nr:TonB-dependent receptor [Gemmatimonadaceae bacterium]MCW5826431.1 TonB-dependent receptor [Gemmatimonadaceae bacterium]
MRALIQASVRTLVLALTFAPLLSAQESPSGRVTSQADGRAIAGAEVLLIGDDTVRARTDGDGWWRAPSLPVNGRTLRVRAMGFVARSVPLGAGTVETLTLVPAAIAMDQVVVSAARREQKLADAVATVEVVSRRDLERSGASDLASVLTEQLGIELQGGHPAGSGAMLQGIGSERVLILLDGQPLAGRLSGNFDLARIPVGMVDRVEVVKGAQSTLYGSEAMGGVINIITRRPGEDGQRLGGSLSGTIGAQGRMDGAGRVQLALGNVATSVDVARRSQETAPGIAQDDGAMAERFDVAATMRWRPDSLRQAEVALLALDERQRWRTGTFYGISDNVQLNARVGGSWARGVHRLSPKLAVSDWDHRAYTSAFTAPVAGDPGARQRQQIVLGELLYNGTFSRGVALDAGVQLRTDAIETERVPGGRRTHTSLEPFAQVELSPLRGLALLPGVRVTHSDVWGTHLTPRVAARAQLAPRLMLRASYGDGFRAPDFKELFLFFQNTSAGYAVQGNPALQPEHSRNAMLGLEWATPGGYVRGQLFQNDFTDFIETQVISAPNEAPVYEYQNRDRGWTRGVELETAANLVASGRLRGELGLSLLETRDVRSGLALLGRPERSGRVGVQAVLPLAVRSSVTLVHTGRTAMQRDSAGAVSSHRDAFTRFDLRVARTLLSGLEFSFGADNLFDRRPREWAGFTGRHVYTSFTYTLPGLR